MNKKYTQEEGIKKGCGWEESKVGEGKYLRKLNIKLIGYKNTI